MTQDDLARDLDLLRRWRAGDRAAGNLLVKRHYAPLRRFLSGKIGDDDARVIAQDAFLALCENLDRFEGYSSFRSYLFGIGRWKLIEYIRRHRRGGGTFDPARESVTDLKLDARLSSIFGVRQREHWVMLAFRSLPVDEQLLISLKSYKELTSREIAEILEIRPSQVEGRLNRARKKLRQSVDRLCRGYGPAHVDGPNLETCIQEVLTMLMPPDGDGEPESGAR